MSKMSDMAQTIEELRSAAAAITDAANWLAWQFSSQSDLSDAISAPESEPSLETVREVSEDMLEDETGEVSN